MNLEAIAAIMGIVGTVLGTFIAVSQFYRSRIKELIDRNTTAATKAYAAQRDFEHLDRHQEQLKSAVVSLQDDLIELEKQMVELQVISKELQVISRGAFNRIEQVAARLDANGITIGGTNKPHQ